MGGYRGTAVLYKPVIGFFGSVQCFVFPSAILISRETKLHQAVKLAVSRAISGGFSGTLTSLISLNPLLGFAAGAAVSYQRPFGIGLATLSSDSTQDVSWKS